MTRPRAYFKVKDRRQARKPNPPIFLASPPRRPTPAPARRSYIFWIGCCAAMLAVLWLYSQLTLLLGALLFAMMAGAVLEPAVSAFEKKGWSRFTGLIAVFALASSIFLFAFKIFSSRLSQEAEALMALFASPKSEQFNARALAALGKVFSWLQSPAVNQRLLNDYARLRQALEQATLDSISALLTSWLAWTVLAVLVLVFMAEGRSLRRAVIHAVPNRHLEKAVWLLHTIPLSLQKFLRIQALTAIAMAATMAFAFYLMHLPGFLIFGILSGCCSFTPYFSSVLGALIILVLGVIPAGSYGLALPVLVAFGTVDITKNIVLSTRACKAGLVLGPLETIMALLAGAGLAGMWGILLSAPMMAMIKIVLRASLQARRDFHATR